MNDKKIAEELIELAKDLVASTKKVEYTSLLDKDYKKGVRLIIKSFKSWKEEPQTEKRMVPEMRSQILKELQNKLV